MRYVEPLVGFLAFLWVSIGSLLANRRLRDWRHKAQMLLGLAGMSLFGLILYTEQIRYSAPVHGFYFAKGTLAGMSIGIFATLWLEGSLNPFKTGTRTKRQRRDGSTDEKGTGAASDE